MLFVPYVIDTELSGLDGLVDLTRLISELRLSSILSGPTGLGSNSTQADRQRAR